MKKKLIIIIICALILFLVMLLIRSPEDSWIKDERGVWVKHGAPSQIPDYVLEQQSAVYCSSQLYQESKSEVAEFTSQCLGTCRDYAVDIVHVPRNSNDNKPENQCEDYRSGKVSHFIELGKDGEIVRIV